MSDQVDHSRRRLLTAATVGTGAIGVAFAAVPFLASWQPSARAKALGAPVAVDASKLESGQMLKVVWRGQAVFVVRRVKAAVDQLGGHDAMLADPKSDDSLQPESPEQDVANASDGLGIGGSGDTARPHGVGRRHGRYVGSVLIQGKRAAKGISLAWRLWLP